ncbi:MAG: sauU 4 [Gemmataceae bacterium]|nr:sauU 4 [Gemmataceae bacterium]
MPQRYLVVGITAVAALWMYIDRVCFSTLAGPVQTDLGLTDREKARILGAFFFSYALFQIPMGTLADRFGARLILTVSIAAWSAVTALTGFAWSFASLFAIRLLLGVTEAGAYPAAAGLVKRWARPQERGRFSSVVALGGRVGGAVAPWMTGKLSLLLAGVGLAVWLTDNPSGVNWRGVLTLYGLCGILVAGLFWVMVRDHPPGQDWLSPAEKKDVTVVGGDPDPSPSPPTPLPHQKREEDPADEWHAMPAGPGPLADAPGPARPLTFFQRMRAITSSRNMWLFGGLQFCNNIPWAVLITLLPEYLGVRGVPFDQVGEVQSLILFVGCGGMVVGGFVTDGLYRWFGPRWGRSLPIAFNMSMCGVMYAVLSSSPVLWVVIAAFALVALFQDLGIPSVWAVAQDVGGRNVGAALGWGNMLGNLGAALSPILITEVRLAGGWTAAFVVCAACYFASAASGFLLDATKPVEEDGPQR